MCIENLDKIFQPNSIAVIGAGERAGRVGYALMRNLIERGLSEQQDYTKHGVASGLVIKKAG